MATISFPMCRFLCNWKDKELNVDYDTCMYIISSNVVDMLKKIPLTDNTNLIIVC